MYFSFPLDLITVIHLLSIIVRLSLQNYGKPIIFEYKNVQTTYEFRTWV